jgi:hypothetical protein
VTIRDSTKTPLVVAVPLIATLALGLGLIVAFGRNSGGAPVSTTAVPPALVPAVSIAAPPSASHICAPRQRSATSFPALSGVVAVTPYPTSVTALWLKRARSKRMSQCDHARRSSALSSACGST